MPLALRLSKWLGLAPFWVGWPLLAASRFTQTPLGEPDKVRVLYRLYAQPRSVMPGPAIPRCHETRVLRGLLGLTRYEPESKAWRECKEDT